MIKRIIESYRAKRRFTAENCRNRQEGEIEKQATTIIEDIQAYINFKVDNTTSEKTVCIDSPKDPEVSRLVEDYYRERGFRVFKTSFSELGNYEFLIISWIL